MRRERCFESFRRGGAWLAVHVESAPRSLAVPGYFYAQARGVEVYR